MAERNLDGCFIRCCQLTPGSRAVKQNCKNVCDSGNGSLEWGQKRGAKMESARPLGVERSGTLRIAQERLGVAGGTKSRFGRPDSSWGKPERSGG